MPCKIETGPELIGEDNIMEKPEERAEQSRQPLPALAMVGLVLLRTVIGWHFLYEGLTKLAAPGWTSAGYLKNSQWILSESFQWVAANPDVLRAVDLLNMWGLTLIGAALLLGCCSRLAAVAGALLLALYYVANPPFFAGVSGVRLEGSYLFLDKNVVECAALLLLASIRTDRFAGIGGLLGMACRQCRPVPRMAPVHAPVTNTARRELLGHLALLPVAGAFAYAFQLKRGWRSLELKHLVEWKRDEKVDAVSGATMKTFKYAPLSKLKGTVPKARIGKLEVSRMFLGGNLIGGWAHSRDLTYVSDLVKAYHTDEKVFQTLHMAECAGMNTILTNPRLARVINDYWKNEGGKIQFFSDCAEGSLMEGAQKSIDGGAHSCYAQGGITDRFVEEGKFDELAEFLKMVRGNGLPAGIGAHKLDTVKACVERGLKPDYWVKTLHHINYWSAKPQPENDNIWCTNPDETIAYMAEREEPWIAFKILAAGAISPQEGFPFALKGGADFLCVGMYDFQLVDNVNYFLDVWAELGGRERGRPWRA
jgi:uncharacterized membrane protein YphA (DoxX/SURF4 family)